MMALFLKYIIYLRHRHNNRANQFRLPLLICIFAISSIFALPSFASSTVAGNSSDSVNNADSAAAKYPKILSAIEIGVRGAYTFSSFRDDVLEPILDMSRARKTKLAAAYHLRYAFRYGPDTRAGRFFPGAYQGIGMAVNDFANRKGLGTPLNIYLFQGAPVWRISRFLSLDYEWNFGLSAGWKPCDAISAKSNLIVGSSVNAYINAGILLRWNVSRNFQLTAGLDLTHFSNGNTSFPNPGVNMAGLRIGGAWLINPLPKKEEYKPDTASLKRRITYDLVAYGAWRRRVYRGGETPQLLNGHFGVAGIGFAPMYEVCRIFRAGVSADFQWDRSTDLKRHYISGSTGDDLQFSKPPFFSQVCVGLSARAELVMPIFSINAGIGYNITGPTETRGSYQLANLRAYVTPGLFINIGYQLLNFHRQNNLMLGLGYTFGSQRKNWAPAIFR